MGQGGRGSIQLRVISSPGMISRVATADMARSLFVNLLYALAINPLLVAGLIQLGARMFSPHFGSQPWFSLCFAHTPWVSSALIVGCAVGGRICPHRVSTGARQKLDGYTNRNFRIQRLKCPTIHCNAKGIRSHNVLDNVDIVSLASR